MHICLDTRSPRLNVSDEMYQTKIVELKNLTFIRDVLIKLLNQPHYIAFFKKKKKRRKFTALIKAVIMSNSELTKPEMKLYPFLRYVWDVRTLNWSTKDELHTKSKSYYLKIPEELCIQKQNAHLPRELKMTKMRTTWNCSPTFEQTLKLKATRWSSFVNR